MAEDIWFSFVFPLIKISVYLSIKIIMAFFKLLSTRYSNLLINHMNYKLILKYKFSMIILYFNEIITMKRTIINKLTLFLNKQVNVIKYIFITTQLRLYDKVLL
mgnify:CR=1 FL=1